MAATARIPALAAPTRDSLPEELPNAAAFSEHREFYSPINLISLVKSIPWVWRNLERDTTISHDWGPKRRPGSWALAYLAYVLSRSPDIEPWYNDAREHTALWKLCGFETVPAYQTVWERFAELELKADAFERAAAAVIQHARKQDPRIGAWIHVDSTEAETHGAPRHDCGPGDSCPTRGRSRQRSQLPRLGTGVATAVREAAAGQPFEEPEEPATVAGVTAQPIKRKLIDLERGGVRFYTGGHWWFSRDATAGTRAYTTGRRAVRAWHGFNNQKAIDHYTRLPLGVRLSAADTQEYNGYEALLDAVIENIDGIPLAMAGDRGYGHSIVYERNTKLGITTVVPYRRRNGSSPERPEPGERWDEHGIPTCAHCDGGCDFVRFSTNDGHPRLWFKCAGPQSAACERVQTISCSREWTRLLPVWRTTEVYAALRTSHGQYEHVNRDSRVRYSVAADCLALRPKRIGIACQQLRANAALLIDWLWASIRQGWLGSSGRHATPKPTPTGPAHERMLKGRHLRGLTGGGKASSKRPPPAHASP